MNKPKILIVEDESIVALDMKKTLENFDFEVTDMAGNYNSALNSVRINKPDLIIMDINLENSKDGIETVKKIHKISKIPVIYITAYADDNTIIRAIETNPVSYLIKPFNRDELKSNILLGLYKNNILNNNYVNQNNYEIGLDYYYDYDTKRLFYKDLPLKLSIKESALLRILIDAKGELVTFKELENQLWPSMDVAPSTLRTLIYRLRSKLEHKLIETEAMIGCKLIVSNKEKS